MTGLEKLASVHATVQNRFNTERSHPSRDVYKLNRTATLDGWRDLRADWRQALLPELRRGRIRLTAPPILTS